MGPLTVAAATRTQDSSVLASRFRLRMLATGWLFAAIAVTVADGSDSPPLHSRVDAMIEAAAGGAIAEPATDVEFHRRVRLDLWGRIPTVEETRAFLDDSAEDKRTRLIDRGLASPAFARRMRDALHVMLMERLGDHEEWLRFLEQSFAERKGWDDIVRTILDPPGDDPARRGAAFFWTKRLENYGQNPVDYPALTRDVGRLFLGVDLQCAQCHNHLFVDDYKQIDYQGLFAFVGHTFIRKDVDFPAVGENLLAAPVEFTSVLTAEQGRTGPRLPGGMAVEIPTFPKGEEYSIPPDKKARTPGVPKFRPLAVLAGQVTASDNMAFARNSVNRFWFLLFGRGLVHPLDLNHPENPASHPELLDMLAREFAAHDCDVRWLLRELMLTRAYARSSRLPSNHEHVPESSFRVALERPLSAEQLLASVIVAVGDGELLPVVVDAVPGDRLPTAYLQQRDRFRAVFANIPRDPEVDFRPSVAGALFLMHNPAVLKWFDSPESSGTLERLRALPDERVAEELYVSVLSRPPTTEEQAQVVGFLANASGRRSEILGDLLWGLVASAEFALNH